MEKIVLSEQSKKFEKIKEYWFKTARSIKSVSDLKDFYSSLFNDYVHDYGTMVHAIGAFAVAAASLGADTMGITGFQAGFVMWDFIQNWTYTHNKTGLKIVDYDNMLYPQYDYKFVCLSHNTLRGAAGGGVLLAETLCSKGIIESKF